MTSTQPLTPAAAKAVYDRIGSLLDTQSLFEGRFKDELVRHAALGSARSVLEFGTGTGTFAERLLRDELPPEARYLGVDQSSTMLALTRKRIAPWGDRARVLESDGSPRLAVPDGAFDRFVATYVLDLLEDDYIRKILSEAHRVLELGGMLCLAGLAPGRSGCERVVSGAIQTVWSLNPKLLGGCRPIHLEPFLDPSQWRLTYRHRGAVCGVTSEVLIAEAVRRPSTGTVARSPAAST